MKAQIEHEGAKDEKGAKGATLSEPEAAQKATACKDARTKLESMRRNAADVGEEMIQQNIEDLIAMKKQD